MKGQYPKRTLSNKMVVVEYIFKTFIKSFMKPLFYLIAKESKRKRVTISRNIC